MDQEATFNVRKLRIHLLWTEKRLNEYHHTLEARAIGASMFVGDSN